MGSSEAAEQNSSAGFPPARAGDAPPLAAPAHLQNTPRLYPEIQLAQFLPEVKTDRRGHSKGEGSPKPSPAPFHAGGAHGCR